MVVKWWSSNAYSRSHNGQTASYLSLMPFPVTFTAPSASLYETLDALASRLGALKPGGERDLDAAQRYLLKSFGEGKLGRWTLDDLEAGWMAEGEGEGGLPLLEANVLPARTLDERVAQTVKRFMEIQQTEKDRRAEGIPENKTQAKKMQKKVDAEKRKSLAAGKLRGKQLHPAERRGDEPRR